AGSTLFFRATDGSVGFELFKSTSTANLSGRAFLDLNANGAQDAGEPGVAGLVVFLDTNNNGTRDAGEPTATTVPAGDYLFSALAAGNYTVRLSQQPGTLVTGPLSGSHSVGLSGADVTGRDFGVRLNSPLYPLVASSDLFHAPNPDA